MTLKLDNFGRMLIPKLIRQIMDIEPGDDLEVLVDEATRKVTLRKSPKIDDAVLTINDWGFPVVKLGLSEKVDFDVSAHVHSIRQEYLDRKFGLE